MVCSRFCMCFQTKRKRRRRKVEMWISVQDVLSAISSHQHFSASGRSGLREYQYCLRGEPSARLQRRMFSLGWALAGGKVGLTEIYFAGWSSLWGTNLCQTSGWLNGIISGNGCWKTLTLILVSAFPAAGTLVNIFMSFPSFLRMSVRISWFVHTLYL